MIGGIYLAQELNGLCKCTCSAPEDKERLHSCPDVDPGALVCTAVPPGVQRALPKRKQTRRDSSFSLRSLVISMQFSTMPSKTETGLELFLGVSKPFMGTSKLLCLEFCYNKYSIELELVLEYCHFFPGLFLPHVSLKQASGKSASNCVQGRSSISLQDTC